MWRKLLRRFARTPSQAEPAPSDSSAATASSQSLSIHAPQGQDSSEVPEVRNEHGAPVTPISPPDSPARFLTRQRPPPEKVRSPVRARSLWLGVDYGTSMSKLVLTDYDAIDGTRSFPVRPSRGGDGGGCRVPSTVSIDSGTLRFGFAAEAQGGADGVYRSLKMLCAYPDRFYGDRVPLPTELDARDLATLFVGHLVQLGQQAAIRYAAELGAEPSFGMTLGVPMAQLDDERLHRMFVLIAREAFELKDRIDLLGEVAVDDAVAALAATRDGLAGKEVAEPRDWVRSEAEAALFWAHSSPDIAPGRYSCVDVGAGTTSASWFHINTARVGDDVVKDKLSFYGAACTPPGCDALDAVIADDLGLQTRAAARGKETESIPCLSDAGSDQAQNVLAEMARVFGEASGEAYEKQQSYAAWRGIGHVFFLGGGGQIEAVRERVIEQRKIWLKQAPIADPGVPVDLAEEDGTDLREDPTFLLVAYGLARRLADVPDTFRPSEIPALKPALGKRERLHHETSTPLEFVVSLRLPLPLGDVGCRGLAPPTVG